VTCEMCDTHRERRIVDLPRMSCPVAILISFLCEVSKV